MATKSLTAITTAATLASLVGCAPPPPDIHIYDIGVGYEGTSPEEFRRAAARANGMLDDVSLRITEEHEFRVSDSQYTDLLAAGTVGSFDRVHDLYFIWSDQNYAGASDPYAWSQFSDRIILIDDDVRTQELDLAEVIREQVDGFVAWKLEQGIPERPSLESTVTPGPPQTYSVAVGLDGISQEVAEALLTGLSEEFTREFNIAFEPTGYFPHTLPESWNIAEEAERLRAISGEGGDIQLVFTDTPWWDTTGKRDYGYASGTFIFSYAHETVLFHEVSHLFGAPHIYHTDTYMNSGISLTNNRWDPLTRKILRERNLSSKLLHKYGSQDVQFSLQAQHQDPAHTP